MSSATRSVSQNHQTRTKRRGRLRRQSLVTAIVSGSLATALVSGVVAQPASAASSPFGGKTLTVYIVQPTVNVQATLKYQLDVAKQFFAATGATLNYEYFSSSAQEESTIETAAATGSGPDVMQLGSTFVPTAYATDTFHALTKSDWGVLGGESAFIAQQAKMGGPNPQSYIGVPVDAVPYAMAYNTTLFKKAGITHAPTTWTQYVQDAEKVNDPSAGIYGTAMDPSDSYDPWKIYWTFSEQAGASLISSNNKTAMLDSNAMKQAAEFWFDWYTKWHIVNPESLTWTNANYEDAFAAGKVGEILLQEVANVPTYTEGAIGTHYAFAPIPTVPYGVTAAPKGSDPALTIVSGMFDVVAKYANVPLALQYLKIVTSPTMQETQWNLLKQLPTTTVAANKLAKATSLAAPFVASEESANPTPFSSAWGTVEVSLASASVAFASQLASGGKLSTNVISSELSKVNSAVQAQL